MGDLLERVHDHERFVDLGPAFGALADVCPKGRNAEADVTVDQQVDLVGEQVSVIHDSSGSLYGTHGC